MSTENEVTALGLRRMWSNPTGEQDSSEGDTKAITCDTLQHTPGIWKNRGMDLLDSPDLLLHLHHGPEFRVRRDDVMKPPARAPPHGEGILELFQNDPFPDHSMESVMEYDLCADA